MSLPLGFLGFMPQRYFRFLHPSRKMELTWLRYALLHIPSLLRNFLPNYYFFEQNWIFLPAVHNDEENVTAANTWFSSFYAPKILQVFASFAKNGTDLITLCIAACIYQAFYVIFFQKPCQFVKLKQSRKVEWVIIPSLLRTFPTREYSNWQNLERKEILLNSFAWVFCPSVTADLNEAHLKIRNSTCCPKALIAFSTQSMRRFYLKASFYFIFLLIPFVKYILMKCLI